MPVPVLRHLFRRGLDVAYRRASDVQN